MKRAVVRVVFDKDGLAVEAQPGDRLLDLCDDVGAPIPFSCRDASCATCLVDVDGKGMLLAPDVNELRLLARVGAGPDQRLACQALVADADGELRVVAADGV